MMDYITEENRIFSEDEYKKIIAEITFPTRDSSRMDIDHVYVDESHRGQGIASHLMELAYAEIKLRGKKIVAKCPYAISWFKKHEEYQDIVINVKTKKL
ncbi:MAG: GNAT family N-acetyltransferase [Candidatus Izemoplasmatales bacterium]|nr:GNAT family N-acetyltransferase [Candidatus Izemoplasmatales bacterium]